MSSSCQITAFGFLRAGLGLSVLGAGLGFLGAGTGLAAALGAGLGFTILEYLQACLCHDAN